MKDDAVVDRQSRHADLRGQSRQSGEYRWRSALYVRSRRYLGSTAISRRLAAEASTASDRSLRGREPRRPLDPRAGRLLSARTSMGRSPAGRGHALTGTTSPTKIARTSASSTSRPTKCTARSARRSAIQREHALRSEQSVCGFKGGVRSSGARLSPHVRTADADHELLEQLRAIPVSGKIDSADDPERARRKAAAGLRRRQERARLALCRRSLRGDCDRAARRTSRRDLQHRRLERKAEPGNCADHLRPGG